MKGIENIKKVVEVLAEFGNVTGAALEDGKINMADVALLARLPVVLPAAFSCVSNLTELKEEFKDLTPEEVQELANHFKTRFDIPQYNIETVIEQAADLLDQAWLVFRAVSLFAGQFRKPAAV
jgi:hypothetical protein